MSEFAMVWHLDGSAADPSEMERMARRLGLAHADATVVHARGPVGACHSALWLDPDSPERAQPLVDAETGCVLVACARIDNRGELAAALGAEAARADEASLLMAAWKQWGTAMPGRLRGDFAFALFDPRQQRVFAARDPLGAMPLVRHFAAGKLLAIATSVRPLLACRSIPAELDEQRIMDYLVLATEGLDETATYFQAIRRMPAGHSMTASKDRSDTLRYHDVCCELDADGRHGDEHYVDELRELLQRAVADRMGPGLRVGSMLSGGLDSNSVAALAGRIERSRGRQLITYSGTSVHPEDAHEMAGIRIAQANPDFDARSLARGDVTAMGDELARFVDDVDEPFDYTNGITFPLYHSARKAGLRGVFDGIDADSLLSWDDYITRLWRRGRWVRAARESVALSAFHLCGPGDTALIAWENLRPALVPPALRRWKGRRVSTDAYRTRENRKLAAIWNLSEEAAHRFDLSGRLRRGVHHFGAGVDSLDELRRQTLAHPVTIGVIERFHRSGRAAGILPLHPFFDLRLFEFAARLPQALRLREGWIKWVLRRSMEGIVAPELLWRRGKDHVGRSFQSEFLQHRLPDFRADIESARCLLEPFVDVQRSLPILEAQAKARPRNQLMGCETQVARIQQLARWLTTVSRWTVETRGASP